MAPGILEEEPASGVPVIDLSPEARRQAAVTGKPIDNGLRHKVASRLGFVEPLLTAETFTIVIEQLAARVCGKLDKAGLGARRLDLLFERVDGSVQAIRVGTARPSRNAAHLGRLLRERLETVDPGLGWRQCGWSHPWLIG